MIGSPQFDDAQLYVQLFNQAQDSYGDLGLTIEPYKNRLREVLSKHPRKPLSATSAVDLFKHLHTDDLYLTTACAEGLDAAWQQFDRRFRNYIAQLANHEYQNSDAAAEFAGSLLTDLYLSDKSARSRIASYDGQASLSRWLRVVVSNRAADERKRKWNGFATLEAAEQAADEGYLDQLEAQIRANRYSPFITASLQSACRMLSSRERMILLLKYDEVLESKQIAKLLGIHPSGVTRLLEQIHQKIRQQMIATLAEEDGLSREAIKECFLEVIGNPEYSMLDFLKAS